MALEIVAPPPNPATGLGAVGARPITEGQPMALADAAQSDGGGSFWSLLDKVGTTVSDGANSLAEAFFDRRASDIRGDTETTTTSTGDPADQTLSGPAGSVGAFIQTYKGPLIAGGVALAAIGVVLLLRRK